MSYISSVRQQSPYYDSSEAHSGPLMSHRSRLATAQDRFSPTSPPKSYRSATGSTFGAERRYSGQHELFASPSTSDPRAAALSWAEHVIGESLPHNDHDLCKHLLDGSILCKLMDHVYPGSIQQFFPLPDTEEEADHNITVFFSAYDGINPPAECRFSYEDLVYDGYDERPRITRAIHLLMRASNEREHTPIPSLRGLNRDVINIVDQDGNSPGSVISHRTMSTAKYSSQSYRATSPPDSNGSLMPLRSYSSPPAAASDSIRTATHKSVQAAAGVTRLMQQCTAMLRDRMYDPRSQQQLLTPTSSNRFLQTTVSSPELPAASLDNLGPVLENVLGSLTQEYEKRLLAKDHEISSAKERIKLLEHRLSAREVEVARREEELSREMQQAHVRVEQLREQAAQMSQSDLDGLMAREAYLQQQVEQLHMVHQQLKEQLEQRDREHEERTAMLHAENAQLQEQLGQYADIYERYEAIKCQNRELYNQVQDLKGSIRVFCRVRPPGLTGDPSAACTDVGVDGELAIYDPSTQERRTFNFDRVFDVNSSQEEVYEDTQPLVRSVLDGYNVCIFAYGQTGSGKTHTMSGTDVEHEGGRGINYRALDDLFKLRQQRQDELEYEIKVQMLEIYNDNLRDLLAEDPTAKLDIMSSEPSGDNVPGVTQEVVTCTEDVLRIMAQGSKNRATSGTKMNDRSSRSHQVVTVVVRGCNLHTGAKSQGCLHLVDLAGSERVGKSEAQGDRLLEAQHINKSLSALGDVMAALADKGRAHVPYRNSKLTLLLEKSLSGNAKVMMFMHISPEETSYNESVTTMKFGTRVSEITLGRAKRNSESGKVFKAHEEAQRLRHALDAALVDKEQVARHRDELMHELLRVKQRQQLQVEARRELSPTPPSTRDVSQELPRVPRLPLNQIAHAAAQEQLVEALDTVSPLMSARTLPGDQSPYATSSGGTPKASRLPLAPLAKALPPSNLSGSSKLAEQRCVDRSSLRRSSISSASINMPAPPLVRSNTLPSAPLSTRTGGTFRPSSSSAARCGPAASASALLPSTSMAAKQDKLAASGSKTARTTGIYGGSGGGGSMSSAAAVAAVRPSTAGASGASGSRTSRTSNVFANGLVTGRQGGVFSGSRAAAAGGTAAAGDRPGNLTSRRTGIPGNGWK